MKIVFLDFDGVLNSRTWMMNNQHRVATNHMWLHETVDELAVARVEIICKATGAKVVVSSTWRRVHSLEKLRSILANHGFTGEVVGTTPTLGSARGNEIAQWLNTNGPIEGFVIIDDDSDMVHLSHKLVQTQFEFGLVDSDVPKAVEVLNSQEVI